MLVDKVTHMSTRAVQQLSKEMRSSDGGKLKAPKEKMFIELDEQMQYLFNKLKNKMGKKLSNKEILRRILTEMTDKGNFTVEKSNRQKDAKKLQVTSKNFSAENQNYLRKNPDRSRNESVESFCTEKFEDSEVESRYVSKAKEREVRARTQGRCSHKGCKKPIEELHHKIPYAIARNHKSLVGLCKVHHEFNHNGVGCELNGIDLKIREMRQ
ncbi:hypothetical protein GF354_06030 [Candidatus Peregrinibacteria bacterium]|nr:hypothetical protein [Candidatus Peregrinibacteria bacterium]